MSNIQIFSKLNYIIENLDVMLVPLKYRVVLISWVKAKNKSAAVFLLKHSYSHKNNKQLYIGIPVADNFIWFNNHLIV
jgi:hypothetical protein